MSIVDTVKSVFGVGSSSISLDMYECEDCDSTFESAKTADRAQCPDCLSNDVHQFE